MFGHVSTVMDVIHLHREEKPMLRTRPGRAVIISSAFALALAVAVGPSAGAASAPVVVGAHEFQNDPPAESTVNRLIPSSMSQARVPSSHVPRPASLTIAGNGATRTISGLTMQDQRTADGGNQFSLEPPDQGLCVGNGLVVEAVNTVFQIYPTSGEPANAESTSLTQFFTGKRQIDRTVAPPTYGNFLSDPKCYFDPDSQRFYMTVLEIDQNSATGDFGPRTATYLAVSKTSTPTVDPSTWWLYTIDTTDDGTADQSGAGIPATDPVGTTLQDNPGCPCLGDQPLIGADKYGFYISTNEFSLSGSEFNGAQIYALDKAGLENGTFTMQAIHGAPIALAEGPAYSLQPATSPTASDWDTADNGTEYFLSALDFNATLDNRIAQWRLTNTKSLSTGNGTITLEPPVIIPTQVYGQPPAASQKTGPTPLGSVLKQRENLIECNDDRMNQVVLQGGHLWGATNTVVKTQNGPTASGIAWFAVKADATNPSIVKQGYVAANNQSVLFPSIGVNAQGKGVMTFSLTGPDYFPSSAYVKLDATSGVTSSIHIIREGAAPADGFTGYQYFGGTGVERWGDYSAAVPDTDGSIWVAAEDIPGTVNGFFANWGTSVAQVTP